MRFCELWDAYAQHMHHKTSARVFEFGDFKTVDSANFINDIKRSEAYWRRTQTGSRRRIAVVAENSYTYMVSLFGIMLAEEIAVPINQNMVADVLLQFVKELDIDVMLLDEDWFDELGHGAAGDNVSVVSLEKAFDDEPYTGDEQLMGVSEDDTILMLLSSGTSGKSKAVELTQRNLTTSVKAIFMECEDDPQEVLQVLPMYHIGGIILTIEDLMRGNTITISNAKYYLLQIQEHDYDKVIMVPAMASQLFKKASDTPGITEGLGHISEMLCVGAPLSPETADVMMSYGIKPHVYYGMTESTGTVSFLGEYKKGACGKVAEHNEVRIVDGEILIRGDNVMKGYYHNEEETARVLKDGWLYTGDLGEIDDEGYLFIKGRSKNIIILSNGENVSPEELEDKILREAPVEEVIVYANDDNLIAAKIYCGVDEDRQQEVRKCIRKLNRTLPVTQKIKDIVFTEEPLEKSGIGKIKR